MSIHYSTNRYPKCWDMSTISFSTFSDNLITFSDPCTSILLSNNSSDDVTIQFNGDDNAVVTLQGNTSMNFKDDFVLTSVAIDNPSEDTVVVSVVAGLVK